MKEQFEKSKDLFAFLAVDRKYTNSDEGHRSIRVFNILAFTFFIFYVITSIPFFLAESNVVVYLLLFESLLFGFSIALTKRGHFLIAKNAISLALLAGIITLGDVLGPDSFSHILFFPFVISQFIIFNKHEVWNRNFYILIAAAQFFIMEFYPINYYGGVTLKHQNERILEFWIFLISFVANGAAVYYFLQINHEYRSRIKSYLKETKILNTELSDQSVQIKNSLEELSQLNKKLEINEKRFRFISENSKDILVLIDKECIIQYTSPSITEMLGFTQDEVNNQDLNDFIIDKDIKKQIYKNGSGDIRLKDKTGAFRWFDVIFGEIKDDEFEGYQISLRDISDKKKVEFELNSNRSMIERIAETTPNFLYVFHHKEKKISYLNRSIWDYLGYDMNTLLSMNLDDFHIIHPDDKKILEKKFNELRQATLGMVISSEYRMKNSEGDWIWFESRDTVLEKTPDDKELVLSLGEARDITELKENESFLLKKQNELLSFVQAAPAAIAMLDTDMTYIAASQRWYEDYHLDYKDILGKTHYQIFPHLDERWKEIHRACLNGEKRKEDEDIFIVEDGTKMWLKWEILPWYRKPDEIGGIIMLTEDITARKHEAEELKMAKLQAEKASEAKAQFLSTMSHEIRTPLNSVIGMTNLLLSEDPKTEQIENLNALNFGAQSLMALVNDILDFSKIEAGRIRFESTVFDLHRLLKNVTDSFKVLAKDKDIEIILEKDPELVNYIKGDPTRLSQILNNLIGNAVKFTQKGFVKLKVGMLKGKVKTNSIQFIIEDSGIGIPIEKQELIFDSFSQASSATTRKYGGTGLGLTITKKLIDLQNGNIKLESELGKGTKFIIELDYEVTEENDLKKKLIVNHAISEDTLNHHILLVEDNKMNQLVAGKFLKKWNVTFDIAENGREAVEMVEKENYDLILMDLHMPEMDGYEATQMIRGMSNDKKDIPIIALSASTGPGAEEKMEETGMNGFVAKPFDPKDLFNAIKTLAVQRG